MDYATIAVVLAVGGFLWRQIASLDRRMSGMENRLADVDRRLAALAGRITGWQSTRHPA